MDISLSEDESTFCLSVAILLIKEYEKDKRKTSYLEFGYYLILSYSLQSDNYEPLFDLSTNLGFYPISKYVLENGMIDEERLHHYFVKNGLIKFEYQKITETLEQRKFRNQLVESEAIDNCYIAPTSFGKSSMMVELITELELAKIFIIVPTKSLLTQTYKLINATFTDRKVIFHDEMYDGESNFIAIFTQERALRLLKSEENMKVDALLLDEAHNLFESSSRSILLSRLIRRIRARKHNSRIFYFSPLISDSDNLKFEEQQNIDTKRIQFNIKEADINEYRLDGRVYKYNRFLDVFFDVKFERDMLTYIDKNKKSNNFLYLRAPRKVEKFAEILAEELPFTENKELEQLAITISKNVHEDFYCVELVKKGVLYIHGKLPDLIKEYLEFNFRKIGALSFIVANSVILEGVNLPIDNLYILNTYSLGAKELTNLIGRVNRLNEVFSGENPSLTKLRPSVHFVNSEEFNRTSSNMATKIGTLKSGKFSDEIKNPTLLNFDISRYDHIIENSISLEAVNSVEREKSNALSIIERENFLTKSPLTKIDRMKAQFYESGLHSAYYDSGSTFDTVLDRVEIMQTDPDSDKLDPIEKVYLIFISGLENEIKDLSFARLQNEKARNYYRSFVKNIHALTLKEHINSTVKYFYTNASETGNNIFYIGSSYGELARDGSVGVTKTYIDLSIKSHKELVNLALVKIIMENDFLSYKLNEFVSLLKDYGVISESDYDIFIYGTAKKRNTDLTRLGLSGAIIKKFESDGQIKNIEIDDFGHISVNDEFKQYLEMQDDLVQFEVKKYITI
jgi:hypothetical protein